MRTAVLQMWLLLLLVVGVASIEALHLIMPKRLRPHQQQQQQQQGGAAGQGAKAAA
jgi:hypothetical protein